MIARSPLALASALLLTLAGGVSASTSTTGREASTTFILYVSVTGIGSVTPNGAVVVAAGGSQTFSIVPGTCAHVADVQVDGVSHGGVTAYTFTNVQSDHMVDVSFAFESDTLLATAGAGGAIVPAGLLPTDCGSDRSFTMTPHMGMHVADVLVDGASVGAVTSYTFRRVSASHSIDAQFEPNVTATLLILSPSPAACGQLVTVRATVVPIGVSGTVQFTDGGVTAATVPLVHGVATWVTNALAIGTHSIVAHYAGDADDPPSTSAPVTERINAQVVTVALRSSPDPSSCGQSVTLTGTATPPVLGSITLFDGTAPLAGYALSGGVATILLTPTVGTHAYTAQINPTTCVQGPRSPALTQTVSPATPAVVTLTSSANPAPCGQTVTLAAALSPPDALGQIQFMDGTTLLATAVVANGAAAYGYVPVGGVHAYAARYLGDACHPGPVTSATLSETITGAVTTTMTLATSANPSLCGDAMTLTATVLPATSAGTVSFLDGSQTVGTASVSAGVARATLQPSTGSHTYTARYTGTACILASTAGPLTQTVNPHPTTLVLAATPNPVPCDQSLTLTATLTPTSAAGMVSFYDAGVLMDSASLSGGRARLVVRRSSGAHTLTASYSGSACNAASTSPGLAVIVGAGGPLDSLKLTTSPNPSSIGQSVQVSLSVWPAVATGTVTFYDGSTPVDSAVVVDGVAVRTLARLHVGVHPLTARYSGDACFPATTAGPVSQTVLALASATALSADPNPAPCGYPTTLTATVTPYPAGGIVSFYDGATLLGTAGLVQGQASFAAALGSTGLHSVHASYGGDATYAMSTSPPVGVTVSLALPSVILQASPSTVPLGQPVTLTATVTPSLATGTVTFMDSLTVLGAAPLASGRAMWTISGLTTGFHSALTARYGGDACWLPGIGTAHVTVTQTQSPTTTTVTTTANPSPYGALLRVRATILPPGLGIVYFFDGTRLFGSATPSKTTGVATFPTYDLLAGTHALTAQYTGDDTTLPSTSEVYTQVITPVGAVVAPAPPSAAVAAAPPPAPALSLPWPNPTTGGLTLRYGLPRAMAVRVAVVDVAGRVRRALVDGVRDAGWHEARWDGRDDRGPVPPGLYLVELTTPLNTLVRGVVVAR